MSWLSAVTAATKPQFGVSILKGSAAPLAAPVHGTKPVVDTGKMCVTAVLTTYTPDRQGDIVNPAGGVFSEHMTNPVVMFHHGKDHKLPIGKAEDASGNYTVRCVKAADGDLLIGTTHFSQSSKFANDVFGLIAEDILRGVSIGFDPLAGEDTVEELGDSPILERPALHFKSWKLLEYSHTPIGVNPEALTAAVQKSLEGTRKLHPVLERVLQPFANPRRTAVVGGFEKGSGCAGMSAKQAAAVAIAKKAKKAKPGVTKAMPDDDEDDTGVGDPTEAGDEDTGASDMGGDDDPGAGAAGGFDPTTDNPSDDPELPPNQYPGTGAPSGEDDTPPTVRALLDGSQGLMDLASAIEAAAKKGEHPGGRQFCTSICQKLRSLAAKMQAKGEGIHSELNGQPAEPDADDMGGESDNDADDVEPDADENAEQDSGESEEPPTDEDGAVVTKGGYTPRRFTFSGFESPTSRPSAVPATRTVHTVAEPHEVKALEAENEKLRAERDELATTLEHILEDIEAGRNRDR